MTSLLAGSATAVSMVAMKQLAERESYRGLHMVSSHHRFHDFLKTTTLQVHKLGVGWCRQCMKIKTIKISAGGSTDKSAKICTHENIPLYGKTPNF